MPILFKPEDSSPSFPYPSEVVVKAQEITQERFRFCHQEHGVTRRLYEWSLRRCAHALSLAKKS